MLWPSIENIACVVREARLATHCHLWENGQNGEKRSSRKTGSVTANFEKFWVQHPSTSPTSMPKFERPVADLGLWAAQISASKFTSHKRELFVLIIWCVNYIPSWQSFFELRCSSCITTLPCIGLQLKRTICRTNEQTEGSGYNLLRQRDEKCGTGNANET